MLALMLTAATLGFPLAGCGMGAALDDMTSSSKDKDVAAKAKPVALKPVSGDLDGNLRQAQLLRQAGKYDEAIHILSQLMLAAADDPRVSAEYGKALAQMGRAQDATQFLNRAIELSPKDWTLYSAIGVAYDQIGDAASARLAYEHALALKPGDATVLNNYALSRMMAKDPASAQLLIAQAQAAAGSAPDEKIARNVALINGMLPKVEADKPVAVASAAKLPQPPLVASAPPQQPARVATAAPRSIVPPPPIAVTPIPVPQPAVAQNNAPRNGAPQNAGDVARLLAGQNPVAAPLPQMASNAPPLPPTSSEVAPGVVMQAVPYDPYAGPVALKKPKPKVAVAKAAPAKDEKTDTAKADAPKPQKTAAATKPNMVPALRVAVDNY
jgi:Flp pilus assembly protein TadD